MQTNMSDPVALFIAELMLSTPGIKVVIESKSGRSSSNIKQRIVKCLEVGTTETAKLTPSKENPDLYTLQIPK